MAITATSISPNTGSAGGGETVHITGTNLTTVTGVTIGGTTAAFEIINAFLVRAIVPAHAAGVVSVIVTDGSSPQTLTNSYTYSAVDSTEKLSSTLQKSWKLDVNTGTVSVPVWTPVRAIGELKDTIDPNLEDDSDYDSGDWGSDVVTQLKWGLEVKVGRKVGVTSGALDPGQESLRAAASHTGAESIRQVRWYDRFGGPEAYSGFGSISWQPEGGDSKALKVATIKISGSGDRADITNPAA